MKTVLITHGIVAGVAVLLTTLFLNARHDADLGDVKVAQADAQLVAVADARRVEREDAQRIQGALNEAIKRNAMLETQLGRAGRAAGRLQRTLDEANTRLTTAGRDAVAQYAATVNSVLGECREALRDMGRKAAGHASDVQTYRDGWPGAKER